MLTGAFSPHWKRAGFMHTPNITFFNRYPNIATQTGFSMLNRALVGFDPADGADGNDLFSNLSSTISLRTSK